jgi:calcineurin-like phosphoesterase family protein
MRAVAGRTPEVWLDISGPMRPFSIVRSTGLSLRHSFTEKRMTPSVNGSDPIHVIFRFRDLVAKSLEEHQAIIREYGYAWWGWWKRDTEDARADVWAELREAVVERGRLSVGLFDSGGGRVYRAVVTGVVEPVDGTATQAPPLGPDESKKVPSYYRTSPFSRAWLKLDSIESAPVNFFGSYTYSEAPPLPGISPHQLRALKGKLVVDADELRAMDTTIWRVSPGASSRTDRFLAPSIHVYEPISRRPIELKRPGILHLTDLHFDKRKTKGGHIWDRPGSEPLAEMLGQCLQSEHLGIGLIVVTGDLTTVCDPEEFAAAERSLRRLLGILDLGTDNLVVCNGNHDVAFDDGKTTPFNANVDVAPALAGGTETRAYRDFYERLFGHEAHRELAMGRRYVMPHGRVIEIAALNSCRLAQSSVYLPGMGSIGPTALNSVAAELGWNQGDPTPALRIVALHHHVRQVERVLPPEEYDRGFGLAIDAPEMMRSAARFGVRLVLHGHRHVPFLWREEVFDTRDTIQMGSIARVAICGGGSAGSTETDGKRNYFNVIDVATDAITVMQFMAQNGRAFERTSTCVAQVESFNGAMELGPWTPK